MQYIFLYVWDIAVTAESTSGRRFCALFEYVLHYLEGNERTGDIRSSWVDVTTAAGPILLRLDRTTKMGVFWSYFRDFVRAQKIEDSSESKNFFAKVIQIKSRFVLAEKKIGVRCTLKNKYEIIMMIQDSEHASYIAAVQSYPEYRVFNNNRSRH